MSSSYARSNYILVIWKEKRF